MKQLLPPLVFGLLAIGYMAIATGFGDDTSAEAPMLYGGMMLGLSVLLGGLSLVPSFRSAAPAHHVANGSTWALVEIYGLIAGFIGLIFLVGFYLAILVFLVAFLRLRSGLSWVHAVLFALGSCGFTWLVFGYFLHLAVFGGYLSRYV